MLAVTFVSSAFLLLIPFVDAHLQVRLMDGTAPWNGVLEMLYNGTWRQVCFDRFRTQESLVTCRTLGFNTSQVFTMLIHTFGIKMGYVLIENLRCTGEETSLNQCQQTGVTSNARCFYISYTFCNTQEKRVRLRDIYDIGPNRGQVQVDIGDGHWMTLCLSSNITARVVCSQLGLSSKRQSAMLTSREMSVEKSYSNRGMTIFSVCFGNETSIVECRHEVSLKKDCLNNLLCIDSPLTIKSEGSRYPVMEETNATLKCESNQRSGLIKYTWPENAGGFPDGSSLIINTVTSKHNGSRVRCEAMYSDGEVVSSDTLQLQVYYRPVIRITRRDNQGQPLSTFSDVTKGHNVTFVCDADSNPPPASITWSGKVSSTTGELHIIAAEQTTHDGVYTCTVVTETDVYDTRLPLRASYHLALIIKGSNIFCFMVEEFERIMNKGHSSQQAVRLANGTWWAGRLEVLNRGEWSTMCDDRFGKQNAQVVCRMLGFDSPEALVVSSAMYGEGSGKIAFYTFECRGDETSLTWCRRMYFSDYCSRGKVVGVACAVLSTQLRLAGTRRTRLDMGRVEILFGAAWTTLCVSNFSSSVAKVLCIQMNYPSHGSTLVESSSFGPRKGRFLVASLMCRGMETNILGCFQNFHGFSDTCSSSGLGVICSDSSSSLFIVVETNSTSPAYPLMEGTNVTLKCVASLRGLPYLYFSWPETAGGRPSGQYLIFNNLTRSHNGGKVRCMASYGQPPRTPSFTSDTLAVNVYYRPLVRIKWEGNMCEPLESSPSRCVVSQNERVTLYCEADSNPPPASVRWSGQVNSATGQLHILSAQRNMHNGLYTCTVSSEPVSSEGRQTLISTYSVNVIVKYPSKVLKFNVNAGIGRVVTVTEHSRVDMRCEAEGRPTPHMTIVRVTWDKPELASRPRGALELPDQRVELTYKLTAAPCEASGDYRCEVDNVVGKHIQVVSLYVMCAPRRNNNEEQSPILNIAANGGFVSVQLTAYPTPKVKKPLYFGQYTNNITEGTPVWNKIYVTCEANSSLPASVICNITTINMTKSDEGLYKVILNNNYGELPLMFLVQRDEDLGVNVSNIVGAVFGSVFILAVAITVTVFTVKHCRGKKYLRRHGDRNTRHDLQTQVSLEDMKFSDETTDYYKNCSSDVMNMPQREDIMTEDLYVNTAELYQEEDDSDNDYKNVDEINTFKKMY